MTGKERVKKTLRHQEPDCTPTDLGSTATTGIHVKAYFNFRDQLGLPESQKDKPEISSRLLNAVVPEEDIMSILDIDVRGVFLGMPVKSKDEYFSDGSWQDMWGIRRKRSEKSEYWEIIQSPFNDVKITAKKIAEYRWPDPSDPGFYLGLGEKIIKVSPDKNAVVLNINAQVVHLSQFLRGFSLWFEDLILNETLICEIMDMITWFFIRVIDNSFKYLGKLSELVDIVFFADDLGTQENLQISPELYRKIIKPFHKKLFSFVKKNYEKYIMLHSCGAVFPLINDFLECGVDILNPVQVSAKGMEIAKLKNEFGKSLTFWGAIDGMHLLPFGTKKEVSDAVKETIKVLGADGGFVLCSTHNIQPDTPIENVIEMYRKVHTNACR